MRKAILLSSVFTLIAGALFYGSTMAVAKDKSVSKDSDSTDKKNKQDKNKTKVPSAAIPATRTDEDWADKHALLVKKVKDGNIDVVFYGDSITDWMNVDLLHKIIGPRASNIGIAGDYTQHLLYRLQNGELDFGGTPPRAAVMLIGTNNLPVRPNEYNSTNEEICEGTKACIAEIHKKYPEMKILLLGILPRDEQPGTVLRKRIIETNKLYAKLADKSKNVYFLDIGDKLLEKDGTLSKVVMYDALHPTKDTGYTPMLEAIKPTLEEILAEK